MCEFSLFQLFLFYWITLNNWVAYIYQKACFASFELKLQGLHFPSLIAWYLLSQDLTTTIWMNRLLTNLNAIYSKIEMIN